MSLESIAEQTPEFFVTNTPEFVLPEERSIQVFESGILPAFLKPIPQQTEPTTPQLNLILAQQGSGKTTMTINGAKFGLLTTGTVNIDTDTLRMFHPVVEELAHFPEPVCLSTATGLDSRRWYSQLVDASLAARRDVVIQETAQNPDYLVGNLLKFKERGYKISVTALAVPFDISYSRVVSRAVADLELYGFAKMPNIEKMTRSLLGVISLANTIENQELADEVNVLDEQHKSVFHNILTSSGWLYPTGFASSIQAGRNSSKEQYN